MGQGIEMGLFDVKTHFSEVIEKVLREGRPITVTRRGEPVVDIVPTKAAKRGRLTPEEAMKELIGLRDELPILTYSEIKSMRDEGRKP